MVHLQCTILRHSSFSFAFDLRSRPYFYPAIVCIDSSDLLLAIKITTPKPKQRTKASTKQQLTPSKHNLHELILRYRYYPIRNTLHCTPSPSIIHTQHNHESQQRPPTSPRNPPQKASRPRRPPCRLSRLGPHPLHLSQTHHQQGQASQNCQTRNNPNPIQTAFQGRHTVQPRL